MDSLMYFLAARDSCHFKLLAYGHHSSYINCVHLAMMPVIIIMGNLMTLFHRIMLLTSSPTLLSSCINLKCQLSYLLIFIAIQSRLVLMGYTPWPIRKKDPLCC